MKTKLLYLILIGVAITSVSIGTVYATFQNTMTSPASTLVGKGTQYYIQFIEPNPFASVTELDITFPAGTAFGTTAAVAIIQGLPTTGTAITSGTTIQYTFAATSITAGTEVQALAAKVQNTGTTGAQTITYTLKSGSTVDDTGTAPFATQAILPDITDTGTGNVGINNASPAHTLDVGGNIGLSGNIVPSNNNDICIGAGC